MSSACDRDSQPAAQPLVAQPDGAAEHARDPGRRPRHEPSDDLALVAAVAAERLVGTLPRQHDLDVLRGELREESHRHDRCRRQRLLDNPHAVLERLDEIRKADPHGMMLQAKRFRGAPRLVDLVGTLRIVVREAPVNAFIGRGDCLCASAAASAESTPPLRSTPISTSDMSWRSAARVKSSP